MRGEGEGVGAGTGAAPEKGWTETAKRRGGAPARDMVRRGGEEATAAARGQGEDAEERGKEHEGMTDGGCSSRQRRKRRAERRRTWQSWQP